MTHWPDIPGAVNLRDLSVSHFPQGIVYRSADLSQITEEGAVTLSTYIDVVIDVRSTSELKNGVRNIPGVERVHAPIFSDTAYSPSEIAKRYAMYGSQDGFILAYRGILDAMGPTLRVIFKRLRKQRILIHCSAGKDRTGVLCALLLSVAGIEPKVIADEYALTTVGLAQHRENILKTTTNPEHARMMMSSEAIVMTRLLQVIDEEYGGVEALVRRHVTEEDYSAVKARLRSTRL